MFALLAVCVPLVICTPPVAEQIEQKRAELRTIDVARNEENFAFNQNMQSIGRARAQAHRTGVENYDDTDALHAAVAAHVAAQDHFDERWEATENAIQALECQLQQAAGTPLAGATPVQKSDGVAEAARQRPDSDVKARCLAQDGQ